MHADLLQAAVKCFVFGAAATALSQLRPGSLIALVNARYDDGGGGGAVKIVDAQSVVHVGMSVDMGWCKGTRKDGQPCGHVVNKRQGAFCDVHLSQVHCRSAALQVHREHVAMHALQRTLLGTKCAPHMAAMQSSTRTCHKHWHLARSCRHLCADAPCHRLSPGCAAIPPCACRLPSLQTSPRAGAAKGGHGRAP